MEPPTVRAYGKDLVAAVERGDVPVSLVDRVLYRVLRQKCELGLLDPDWSPWAPALGGDTRPARGSVGSGPPPRRSRPTRLAPSRPPGSPGASRKPPAGPVAAVSVVGTHGGRLRHACALIRRWRPLERHTRCCSTRSG
ncbi:hypothetical protein DVH02_21205 [Streptomyces corynorhini]|uniref:Uncharacterized protein n=1 Tax=Streptomyces corynorhini TaxID=2282652 RepID=A0A370B326_9ACTN|nr:hypothetical protein DVH02_21205 [Streptomyces corynorhini]